MMTEAKFTLNPALFGPCEEVLVSADTLSASVWQASTGVCMLRLRNAHGSAVVLPFQGQHVWSLTFGRELTMRSHFREPRPTREFLSTFGGFLQHCGLNGVGVPGPDDTHPIHGELHNAPYTEAFVVVGEDERGQYIGVGGRHEKVVAFGDHYTAEPVARLYADETLLSVAMTITNLSEAPLEYGYLAHINFLPVDYGRLIYSAPRDPAHVRVRTSVPSHISPSPEYVAFLDRLAADPFLHEYLVPDLAADPEVVVFLDYIADGAGWAHTLQLHPDGSADYVRHRPSELPHVTRWISRAADRDALAMAEIGTCETEGFKREKAKGTIRTLAAGEQFGTRFDVGMLNAKEARPLAERVAKLREQ